MQNRLCNPSPPVKRVGETGSSHKTNTEEDVEVVTPKVLLERHTNCQDLKRSNRSGNTNCHMPFVSAESNFVEV
jgi:hypothetical protein